jgi:hypothetical protein
MATFLELLRLRLVILFLIILTAIIMLSPIASNALVPNCADMINHLSAIIQAKMGLEEGQFPLRVMPFLHSGWRYPFYQFYSSTAYLAAGALFMLTPWNPFITFKLTILLAIVVGGIYMYRLANIFVSSHYAALLASIAYLTSPYYLIVLDHMFDFTESIALGMVPVTLYYTLKLFYFPRTAQTFLLMSLSWYLLATIHIVTFFYTFMFLGFLLIAFTCMHRNYWRSLLWLGGGFIFAMALAAWCLLPILEIKKFLFVENYYGVDQFLRYFSTALTSLFSPIANILPLHLEARKTTNIVFMLRPNIGIPFLFAIAMSLYIFIRQEKINPIADAWMLPLLMTALFILLLIWAPLRIWSYLPHTLTVAQYSWRLLGGFSWVAALLFAIAFAWLFPAGTITLKYLLISFFCVVLATSSWYRVSDLGYTFADFPGMIKNPLTYNIEDVYLPNPRTLTMNKPVSSLKQPLIIPIKESQQYCHQNKNMTKCSLPISTAAKIIQLPILYYPKLLSILLNGKKVSYQGMLYQDKLLAAITTVPNIENTIEIQFEGLAYANKISGLSWCVWILLWLYQIKRLFPLRSSRKQELTLCVK